MSESRDRFVLVCQQALVLAVVGAVALPAAGVISLDIVSPKTPSTSENAGTGAAGPGLPSEGASLVAAEPVEAQVREIPLTAPGSTVGRRANRADVPAVAITTPTTVGGFATVGVTWDPSAEVGEDAITVSVRSKVEGRWSGWEPLEYHDEHAPEADSPEHTDNRPGTEAYVIGDVEGVQVRAQSDGPLPTGMRVALIDPGATEAVAVERPAIDTAALASYSPRTLSTDPPAEQPTDPPAEPVLDPEPENPGFTPVAGTDVTPQPKIFSRAQWGADERMRNKSSLKYGEVHAAFVHHTVNANGYTKKQVPSIIRGIYAYHTQSRGWSDVGYNFLVDRFGRIWEGRAGGVDRPVVGAHTLGYNDYAFAMSAIGNFETAQPTAALIDAYARLFAWKLSLHGIAGGATRQVVGSRTFPAINGHRDAGSTACPGRHLYAKLGQIRSLTASYQKPFVSRNLQAQISGSTWPDLVVRDKASRAVSVVRTGGQIRHLKGVRIARNWKGVDLIATPGDVTGNGHADVVARVAATGTTAVYPGSPSGALGGAVQSTNAFKDYDLLIGVGDFNRDGRPDLVGRHQGTKKLYLVPGKAKGDFGQPIELASNWTYDLTTGVGDFDRDGRVDLVARDGAGRLFLVPSVGNQKLGAPRQIGSGFGSADLISGRGDVTNDGHPDLVVRDSASKLTRVYAGDGSGGLGPAYGPWKRFKKLSWLGVGGQFVGSGAQDVLGINKNGNLMAFPNSGGRTVVAINRTSVVLKKHTLLLNVGDWNRDGHGDIITRTKKGVLQLRLGNGKDSFAAPTRLAGNWGGQTQVISVGDVTGDGFNDLMARSGNSGPFRIYPGNGVNGLKPDYIAYSAVESTRQVAMGLFDADGAPDTMTTRADGSLWLYPGNGPGGMTRPRKVLSGLQGYDALLGLGDLNGDRRNDLIARRSSGGALMMFPANKKGFAPPQLIATGFGAYDLIG